MEEKTEKRMIEGLGQGYYPACEPKQAKYLYRISMFAAMNHVTIKDIIRIADEIVDVGPDGGSGGGEIVFQGTPGEMLEKADTITAGYLRKDA